MSKNQSSLPPLPSAAGTIDVSSIFIPERLRSEDANTERSIENLKASILENGLIHPITLDSDARTLVSGFCRLSALKALGYTHIPYNLLPPSLTRSDLLILEYEENDARSDMSWQDKVTAIAKIHSQSQTEKGQTWTQSATGKLLGVSLATVNDAVRLAKELKSGNDSVASAKSLRDAIKALYETLEDRATKVLASRESELHSTSSRKPQKRPNESGEISSSGTSGLSLVPKASAPTAEVEPSELAKKADKFTIDLNERIFCGDCLEFAKELEPESIDLIFTDIPYGIDVSMMEDHMDNIKDIKDQHDVDVFLQDAPKWLKTFYKVLRPDAYCVLFYDLTHHEKLQEWAKKAKFKPQKHPLHWIKTHACMNRVPQYHWTKSVEHIMVLRKGAPTLNNTDYTPNWIQADASADRELYKHPFFKPLEVCRWILDKVALKGQTMWDPFAGEGSLLRAGILKGMIPYGSEINSKWIDRLKMTYANAYEDLYRDNVNVEGK